MAGNSNFDTAILSTTLKNYRSTLQDNIFRKTPLFFWLTDKGRKRTVDGGERIVVPLMYGTNSTAMAYSGYQTLDVTPQEGMTAAEYNWKQYAVSIAISGKEMRQNQGKSRVINLLEGKTKQAELSLKTEMNTDAFSTNGDGGVTLTGLGALVAVSPTTGTVGNIDRSQADNSWWRNNSTTSVGAFASNGIDSMRTMFNTCSDAGSDTPDFIITTQTVSEKYESQLQVHERFTDTKLADAGFQNIKFKNVPIMWDPACPTGYMYFLNSDYLSLDVHPDADMEIRPFITPENQDAKVAHILWMGNLTMSQARRQGVLSGIT